jgi:hypothetical protein
VVVLAILGWRRDPSVLVTVGWVMVAFAVYRFLEWRRTTRAESG